MIFKKSLLALAVVSLTSTIMTTSVQAREFGDIYTQCGLGGMIFKNHEVMAAISNVTWDLGTTAVSSNYSSEDSCNGNEVATATFINESYVILEQDIARGEGAHLSALMDITGCATAERSSAIDSLRTDFGTVVSGEGFAESAQYEKSETLYNFIKSEKFSTACNV